MFNARRQNRGGGLALGLLFAQMANVGFNRIPPVTLFTIAAQVALYLRLFSVYWDPSVGSVCVSALKVWYQDDWKRLILATFFHADEWHLYYNMVSMLWKGISLERRLGSVYFGSMLAVFSVLTNLVLVALSIALDLLMGNSSFVTQCAVGFSGVLFALKVVKNYADPPGVEYVMGMIPVPTKIVCWAELVIIHFLVPNSSFIGHLAGILVGMAYVLGPLRWLLEAALAVLPNTNGPSYTYHQGSTGHAYASGNRVGRGTRPNTGSGAAPPRYSNYERYTGGLSEDEQMRRAQEDSMRDYNGHQQSPQMPMPEHYTNPAPPPDTYPYSGPHEASGIPPTHSGYSSVDQELLRNRRLDRFANTRN